MNYDDVFSLMEAMEDIAPLNLRGLIYAVGIVVNEVQDAKSVIDKSLLDAADSRNYDRLQWLTSVSESAHKISEELSEIVKQHERKVWEDSCDNSSSEGLYGLETCGLSVLGAVSRRPVAFSFKGEKYFTSTVGSILIMICELLYEEDSTKFMSLANGMWLTQTKELLRKPVPIKDSGIYVESCMGKKYAVKNIISMLEKYEIPYDSVKIYLRKGKIF